MNRSWVVYMFDVILLKMLGGPCYCTLMALFLLLILLCKRKIGQGLISFLEIIKQELSLPSLLSYSKYQL